MVLNKIYNKIIERMEYRWSGYFETCTMKATLNLVISKIIRSLGINTGPHLWFYKPFNLTGCTFIFNDKVKIKAYSPYNIVFSSPKHEPFQLKILEDHLGEGDIFIDIGAYVGYASLRAARIVGPRGLVVAFEPDPRIYKILIENIILNDLNNIIVIPLPLYSATKIIEFTISPVEGWSSLMTENRNQIFSNNKVVRPQKIKVATLTLDSIPTILGLKEITMIKIDTEGAESEILRGASEILKKHKPKLLIEIHGNKQYKQVMALLNKFKYKFEILHINTEEPIHIHIFAYI